MTLIYIFKYHPPVAQKRDSTRGRRHRDSNVVVLVCNISAQVFDYYVSLGVFEVTRISLAGGQPNDPALTNMFMYEHSQPHLQHWRNEALSVNDCFFRNMDEYKYIVNIDNDEMILSLNHTNWSDMMEDLEQETVNQV